MRDRSADSGLIRTPGPRARLRRSSMPPTSSATSTAAGFNSWRRANASNRWVSAAPRSAPCMALSRSRFARGSSGRRFFSSSRLPNTAMSRLLKSCAIPPVSWPIVSSFCASNSCASACSRSRVRSSIRCSSSSFSRCSCAAEASKAAVRSATRRSSSCVQLLELPRLAIKLGEDPDLGAQHLRHDRHRNIDPPRRPRSRAADRDP